MIIETQKMFKTYIPPTNGNIEELQKLAEKMESY
jgi:hypothetical protein